MSQPASTRNLRICPACWSVVHSDDLDEHSSWHDRMQAEAVSLAKRQLAAERRQRLWRAILMPRPVDVVEANGRLR
jgi:hypothetical protein